MVSARGRARSLGAAYGIGLMYDTGKGVSQDFGEAINWYRKAAEKGFAPAESNLGLMYETGKGVAQDYAQAADWYRRAAEQGLPIVQHNLGNLYSNGRGVPQDRVRAYLWLSLAAARLAGPRKNPAKPH
jgi:uncharacterized protein